MYWQYNRKAKSLEIGKLYSGTGFNNFIEGIINDVFIYIEQDCNRKFCNIR